MIADNQTLDTISKDLQASGVSQNMIDTQQFSNLQQAAGIEAANSHLNNAITSRGTSTGRSI